ncbi:hypothetical protein [Nocardia wallacei]|uniref:hypothetical protein n=1 Tax=Nocardia wallacei TaxID=480035 RepID=UPI002453B2F8|nr:hypothetical protein [Nocardia wallacei]
MGIIVTDWLITSDVALEAAFRIDLPGPDRGQWVLSYLPAEYRFTRPQALAGMMLAEMIVLDPLAAEDDWDADVASMCAAELGLTLTQAQCLLALRALGASDYDSCEDDDSPEPEPFSPCTAGWRK